MGEPGFWLIARFEKPFPINGQNRTPGVISHVFQLAYYQLWVNLSATFNRGRSCTDLDPDPHGDDQTLELEDTWGGNSHRVVMPPTYSSSKPSPGSYKWSFWKANHYKWCLSMAELLEQFDHLCEQPGRTGALDPWPQLESSGDQVPTPVATGLPLPYTPAVRSPGVGSSWWPWSTQTPHRRFAAFGSGSSAASWRLKEKGHETTTETTKRIHRNNLLGQSLLVNKLVDG